MSRSRPVHSTRERWESHPQILGAGGWISKSRGASIPHDQLYLHGVYAPLNLWRPDREEDGWKIGQYKVEYDSNDAPARVHMVKRMVFDVRALEELTQSPLPPERLLRPAQHGAKPIYVFGDASGAGFGVSSWTPKSVYVQAEHGTWDTNIAKKSTSNFRELANIVFSIERIDRNNEISDATEIFVFTDNQHAESAFYRATAKSPGLLELMFCLHKILIKGYAFIHITWEVGWQMINQGTDGLS
ncbi:hypothetical protein ACA910_010231 [Epithemia clementina (nom. ined.)]